MVLCVQPPAPTTTLFLGSYKSVAFLLMESTIVYTFLTLLLGTMELHYTKNNVLVTYWFPMKRFLPGAVSCSWWAFSQPFCPLANSVYRVGLPASVQSQDHLIPTSRVSSPPAQIQIRASWSGCRVWVWVQVQAPANHLAISANHSQRLFQKTIKGFDCKINAELLGQHSQSCTAQAWAGWTSKHKYNFARHFLVGCSCCWPQPAHLNATLWPLLLYWLSSRVKKVLMLCKFLPTASHFSLKWNAICNGICNKVVAYQSSSYCFTQSFDHCLVSE